MTTALRRFWRAPGRDPILPDGRHVPDAGMVFADTTWVLRRLRDGAITHDAPAQPEPAVQDTPTPAETAPTAMSPTPSAKRVRSAAPAANADATPAPEAATPPAGPDAPEPEPAADPAHEE